MKKLIVIEGLTSSGKSELGIKLAQKFNGEIVSADSRQVYKNLDYCSGKVSKDEQSLIKHHLLDEVNLGTQFTLYDYQTLAYKAIDEILLNKKVPFLVGGTGLYVRSVVEGYDLFVQKPDESVRAQLNELSLNDLLLLCKKYNLETGSEPTKRRLIRLIETKDRPKAINKPKYKTLTIGIKFEREEIYERIKLRLIARMPNMIKEIKTLLSNNVDAEFLKSLGLEAKCVVDYLAGEYNSYEEFFEDLFKQERHYAKRQQTWLNKDKDIIWINGDNKLFETASKLVEDFLKS